MFKIFFFQNHSILISFYLNVLHWTWPFNWGSAQVQILLAACWRFKMVRTLTMLLALAWCFSPVNHATKIIHDHHKLFIRPHLDYVDIIFDQANNFNLCSEIETCQCNAPLAITCDMTGSLKERLYQKLGLRVFESAKLVFTMQIF